MTSKGTTEKSSIHPSNGAQPLDPFDTSVSNDTFHDGVVGTVSRKRARNPFKDDHIVRKVQKEVKQKSATMEATTGESNSSEAEPTTISLSPENIKGLRLEAIFHPKFDNERRESQPRNKKGEFDGIKSSTTSRIRTAMIERLQDQKGYLEVSLKHSGSLILWSGGQRYYSKKFMSQSIHSSGRTTLEATFCKGMVWRWRRQSKSCGRHLRNEIPRVQRLSRNESTDLRF